MKYTITETIAHKIVHYHKWFFISGLCLVLFSLIGLKSFSVQNDYKNYMNDHNLYFQDNNWMKDRINEEKDTISLIYTHQSNNVLSPNAVAAYNTVLSHLNQHKIVDKLYAWTSQDKIIRIPNYPQNTSKQYRTTNILFGTQGDDHKTDALKSIIQDIPTIYGRYIAKDFSSALISISVVLPENHADKIKALTAFRHFIHDLNQDLGQDHTLLVGGSPMFEEASLNILRMDLRKIIPPALCLIVLILWFIYRSWRFASIALLIIFTPIIATAGLMSFMGMAFSTLAISGLLLVGTLAVADVIHISNSYFLTLGSFKDKKEALYKAITKNIWAITATTLTTIIGQIAMANSASPPIQMTGYVMMLGALLALILAILLLPYVLLKSSSTTHTPLLNLSNGLARLSVWSYDHYKSVLSVFCIITVCFVYGVSALSMSDSMKGWFAEDTDFRQTLDRLEDGYFGTSSITAAIEASPEDITDLHHLKEDSPHLKPYRTFHDYYNNDHFDDYLSLPMATIAYKESDQTYLHNNIMLNNKNLREKLPFVTFDSAADAGLMTPYEAGKKNYSLWYFEKNNKSSFDIMQNANDIREHIQKTFPEKDFKVGGLGATFANMSIINYHSVLNGSILAFIIISAVLFFVFHSFKIGLLSLIPNIFPLLACYGIWGLMGNNLNMAALTVFGVAIGIIVDDTIHFTVLFQKHMKSLKNAQQAIFETVQSCGIGLLSTTIIIASGFFLLSLSDFLLTAQKALLVGIAVTAAFICDMIVLPALLRLIYPHKGNNV